MTMILHSRYTIPLFSAGDVIIFIILLIRKIQITKIVQIVSVNVPVAVVRNGWVRDEQTAAQEMDKDHYKEISEGCSCALPSAVAVFAGEAKVREHKYRAWDNGKYWYSDDEAYVLKHIDGRLGLYEDSNFYRETRTPDYMLISLDLEQYTGRKDKNLEDGFENNIYSFPDNTLDDKGPFVLKWEDDNCCYILRSVKNENFQLSIHFLQRMTLIGNIHDKETT